MIIYTWVLYGTVWYCMVLLCCTTLCHMSSTFLQPTYSWVRSIRSDALVEYIPNRVPAQGVEIGPGKVSDQFAENIAILLYIYTINYIYIAFILWLHDVMSCYNMLRYLGLMRDDDLESSLLEGCVETSTCWMNCHGHMRKPSEDSAYSRLQAAIVSAVSFVALFSFFERCPMVFLWQDPSDPQRKRPCATSRLLASGHHSCRSPAVWAKAMVWNKFAK